MEILSIILNIIVIIALGFVWIKQHKLMHKFKNGLAAVRKALMGITTSASVMALLHLYTLVFHDYVVYMLYPSIFLIALTYCLIFIYFIFEKHD